MTLEVCPASKRDATIKFSEANETLLSCKAPYRTHSGRLPKVVSTVCVADLKLGFALNLVVARCGLLVFGAA